MKQQKLALELSYGKMEIGEALMLLQEKLMAGATHVVGMRVQWMEDK